MKCTSKLEKISQIHGSGKALPTLYNPRYAPPRAVNLSSSLDNVTEKNRYLSLEILLHKLSGHAGRRQYRMVHYLPKYLEKFKRVGLDLHGLKALDNDELRYVLDRSFGMNLGEKAILLKALDRKVCGVLCEASTRFSTNICLKRGKKCFGWRCGNRGHVNDMYFEGKHPSTNLAIAGFPCLEISDNYGVKTIVRPEPNFSVVGRINEKPHRRIWKAPEKPLFSVDLIGYEFRVHPKDPRAQAQIVNAEAEWMMHAEVIKQVLWEMIEIYGVECTPQPLAIDSGDFEIDSSLSYSGAFNVPGASDHPAVENKMRSATGEENVWFRLPPPQKQSFGIPVNLPFAPSIVVRSVFKAIPRDLSLDAMERMLLQPVIDVSLFLHPKCCFRWSPEDEVRCSNEILNYVRQMPYALPFYLYFRVDLSSLIQQDSNFVEKKEKLIAEKQSYFDLKSFCTTNKVAVP